MNAEPTALSPTAEQALDERRRQIATDPTRIRVLFPAAAREVARSSGTPAELADPATDRIEDTVRVRMLEELADVLAQDPETLMSEIADLYRFGDADERRAVLFGLSQLAATDRLPDSQRVLDLIGDALRTNDPRLIAAALGGAAADRLDAPGWRQGVLKCLFVGVPLRLVARVEERTDDELVRMVADFAAERRAAGRPVPDDAPPLLLPVTTAPES